MRNNSILLITFLNSCICFLACGDSSTGSNATYDFDLVEQKKITLPIDENTYYQSKSMFQFEENGKEYLHFENTEKRQYEIIIFDIASLCVSKRIPLQKQGPNGVLALKGSKPLGNSNTFLFIQNNVQRITLFKDEQVLHKYPIRSPKAPFIGFHISSYFYTPSFVKDSVLYLVSSAGRPNIKKEDWQTIPMFLSLNLKTDEVDFLPICYPPVFNQDVRNLSVGSEFSYDYNDRQNRLVCSFITYDSLMVTDNLRTVRWYNGKSRYLGRMKPKLMEASDGARKFGELKQGGHYFHLMYDKYRDVYYRFVEHPSEPGPGESYLNDPKAREFSVIIFDKDFNIIGETKFPGNKYYNKMSFIGRDGLYISENNLGNPDFDEDKLVFACFKPEKLKGDNKQ